MANARQPTIFISHGGGPCFWMTLPPPYGPHAFDRLREYLGGLIGQLPERPKAIVVISAHWEEELPTVSFSPAPPMLFDYHGFPEHTYALNYPAPGSPAIAGQVARLLEDAGIDYRRDATRGFDHGVFVPFLIVDPKADIPVVMLSLRSDLDPALHISIGKAIASLRDEGVLIIGSGNSFHNLSAIRRGAMAESLVFDGWLTETVLLDDATERAARLSRWFEAPQAHACHPREEHLIPLMVVAGAAGNDRGSVVFHDEIGGKVVSGYSFGT